MREIVALRETFAIMGDVFFGEFVGTFDTLIDTRCTEGEINVCTWLREISSCSCLTVLPGPAWVLLSKKYILFPGALYTQP